MDHSIYPNMRIGYLLQNGAPDLSTLSGAQLHTIAVIEGLRKLEHGVRTVAVQQNNLRWSDDLDTWYEPKFEFSHKRGFRLFESAIRRVQTEFRLPFIGLFDSLRYADACTELLRGYDLLYERHGYMGYGGIIAARRLKIPIVIELNGNIVKEIDAIGVQMSPIQRRIGRWLTFRTFQKADHVVVVSDTLKQVLVSAVGVSPKRISVVLNGVNLDIFTQPHDLAQLRKQFGLTNVPTVAYVGSFQPWHGVNLLIASFRLVCNVLPTAQLLMIGDGDGREAATKQVDELNLAQNVHFFGNQSQENVAKLLHIADVAAAPYPYRHGEIVGTPLKLMEYMAAGKAIVASTAPLHEIVKDGLTGIRVQSANAQALAEGIIRLLSDEALRWKLSEHARQESQHFSWEQVVQRLNAVFYDQLINRREPMISKDHAYP